MFKRQTVEDYPLVGPLGCRKSPLLTTNLSCVTSQKSEYLIYTAAGPGITQVIRLISNGLRGALGPIQF
jgi:hypothetical protein